MLMFPVLEQSSSSWIRAALLEVEKMIYTIVPLIVLAPNI